MNHKKNRYLVLAASAVIVLTFFVSRSGIAQKIILKPIKPTGSVAVSDEQQAILAVRMVKPSVVDVVGTPKAPKEAPATVTVAPQSEAVEGTGFIIQSDGMIVSNNHVVQDPNMDYTVMFADGSEYPATVVALDKYDDIALLKIEAKNLPAAKLGDSGNLETGQSVFAIGNTLGRYQNTVTRGVVSGLGRSLDVNGNGNPLPRLQQLIQTDAAISPGNSGGPLINMAGEVIGMNTVIDTQGASLGFAIPINTIKDMVQQINTFGKVSRAYLGVKFETLTKQSAAQKNLQVNFGSYIAAVIPGSPADLAGIKVGDVITEINHQKLNGVNELDKVVNKYRAGDQILLSVNRGGETLEIVVLIGQFQ